MKSQGAQVAALRDDGGVLELKLRLLSARGKDCREFLHRVLTSHVRRLAAGEGQPSALLTPKSQVVAFTTVLALEESFLLVTPESCITALQEDLEKLVIVDEVELEEAPHSVLGLFGPRLLGESSLAPLLAKGPGGHGMVAMGPTAVRAVVDDQLGLPGLLLVTREPEAGLAWARERGFASIDAEVHERCRIEAGSPRFGVDVDRETLLLEAGQLGRVSFDKGCYIGQEPVCRIHNRGQVNRQLVGLVLHTSRLPRWGEGLAHEQKEDAGRVTSVARQGQGGTLIGLGYVHRRALEAGGSLRLAEGGEEVVVVKLPHLSALHPPRTLPRYGAQVDK